MLQDTIRLVLLLGGKKATGGQVLDFMSNGAALRAALAIEKGI